MEIRSILERLRTRLCGPALPPDTDAIIEGVMSRPLPELVRGNTGYASSSGVRIWYESILPQDRPAGSVMLHMGMAGDALTWPPSSVNAFVDAGYQVVRYDYRGTGLSDWMEDWDRKRPYSVGDMAQDALSVIHAVGLQRAHLVGLSLGGMIAQEIAIRDPDRVASLTLMMTSGFIGDPDLPSLTSGYFVETLVRSLPLLRYRLMGGEKNLIKERIAKLIAAIGYEGTDVREIAEVVLYSLRKRRGINLRAMLQHQAAITVAGSRHERLRTLNVPTLVVHGTEDRLIPVEHGRKLVDTMPSARGIWLEGVGHVFPAPDMERLTQTILSHTRSAA